MRKCLSSIKAQVKMKKKKKRMILMLYNQTVTYNGTKVSNFIATTNQRAFYFSQQNILSCTSGTGSKIFHCLYYRISEKKHTQSLPTVWSWQGWQTNPTASSQACHNCTLMTSQAVGLSPAPNVTQGSPENIQILEVSPQSHDGIYLTHWKQIVNVIR